MAYALDIGLRHLRSKKRSTVSVITVVAIVGVALGVGALVSVLSITSGFQEAFRDEVLGVNAHVLVLKYGIDFEEYRDVIARAEDMPEVVGAAPFVINEMMIAKGSRIASVLVKGIDPERMPSVLDLPEQMIDGTLDGLRLPGSEPPVSPGQLGNLPESGEDLDRYLRGLADGDATGRALDTAAARDAGAGAQEETLDEDEMEALRDQIAATGGREPVIVAPEGGEGEAEEPGEGEGEVASDEGEDEGEEDDDEELPVVRVPTPEEMEAALRELEAGEGLPDETSERQIFEEEDLEIDRILDPDEPLPGVVVGTTLARNLGLGVGDRVRIISPLAGLDTSFWAPEARTPRSRELRVIGIFEAGFQEYDSRLVYVDLHEAQRFFDQGDTVTGVEMRIRDIDDAPEIARRIERDLGGGPFHTMDWQELNRNLFTALAFQKLALSIVTLTIIVVAAFMVIATLIMIVLEKKREIAILKAMGAKDGSILTIFLIQGVVVGIAGTVLGLVLGGGAVLYLYEYQFPLDPRVYLIDHLPVRLDAQDFILTSVLALVICTIATLIPSWWAARLLPAEGVRYE